MTDLVDKNAIPTKILWVDLEMTGLDPKKDVILEVSAEVTDVNFKTLASYEAIIKQPLEALANMNEWATKQHAASGLTAKIQDGKDPDVVQREVAGFIKSNFGSEPAILAGNSIHNDRLFINSWWPEVEALLHYRMLDVSSFKIVMQSKYGVVFEKPEVHRAFEDIQASIAELQFYLDWFDKNGSQNG